MAATWCDKHVLGAVPRWHAMSCVLRKSQHGRRTQTGPLAGAGRPGMPYPTSPPMYFGGWGLAGHTGQRPA